MRFPEFSWQTGVILRGKCAFEVSKKFRICKRHTFFTPYLFRVAEWRRNGEAVENENEFYRMNYWHHLLIDMDLLALRMAAMVLRDRIFFKSVLARFELGSWLKPGDPLELLFSKPSEDEFMLPKLQSFVLFLQHLLAIL